MVSSRGVISGSGESLLGRQVGEQRPAPARHLGHLPERLAAGQAERAERADVGEPGELRRSRGRSGWARSAVSANGRRARSASIASPACLAQAVDVAQAEPDSRRPPSGSASRSG